MLRVLILCTDLKRGGLPLRMARLAQKLPSAGIEPVVGCLAPRGPLNDELERAGVATFSCGARGARDVGVLWRLTEAIQRVDPTIVHAALFHANLAVRMCKLIAPGRPIITSTVTIEIERAWHRWLEALTSEWSDLHVANSQAVAEHLTCDLGFAPGKVKVIENGLDLEEIDRSPKADRTIQGLSENTPLIIWAGRLDPAKNLGMFVEVVSRMRRKVEVAGLILGDGPEKAYVENEILRHGMGGVIRLGGWTQDVVGWLKAADVLLFPSWTEGAPNVVLEAMACELPVVASDIPACRELLKGGAGRLSPADDAEGLAHAVLETIDGGEATRRQVCAARKRIQHENDLNQVVKAWAETYRSLAMGR